MKVFNCTSLEFLFSCLYCAHRSICQFVVPVCFPFLLLQLPFLIVFCLHSIICSPLNFNVLIPSPLLLSSVLKVFYNKILMHISVCSYNTVPLVLGGIQFWSSARDSESA